ncbi:AAA family ATPase [Clostridium phoceensis]|uniref:AAA family ATPase n=2 Tax=Clostridium phoceensis TaxID=1650661 RepID=UPI00266FAC1C|nr:AAA family ATPase [Clostridium phoceensis]
MKIKRMTASFGGLEGARLELGPGLNVIQAPNEGGKSTWAGFLKAMLYGIDTRDRDRKGYLADKNRYQPWSGAPMEGELVLTWHGRDITLRRGRQGNSPFGAFSAVYTGTEEPVPGLTGDTCGQLLLGVGQEVFERSAFVGQGGSLAVTSVPELERRIAALVSSGEEDVSFSQAEGQLREWLNRRKVNKSVGLIPRLEGELAETGAVLSRLEEANRTLSRLEGEKAELEGRKTVLEAERRTHRRLDALELDRRYTQARQDLEAARRQADALEREQARYGALPEREELKRAQGELQYLKVLEEEIRQGEGALREAEEAYEQARREALDDRFNGMSGEEAVSRAAADGALWREALERARREKRRFPLLLSVGLALLVLSAALGAVLDGSFLPWLLGGAACCGALALAAVLALRRAGRASAQADQVLARYRAGSGEEIAALAEDYRRRDETAQEASRQAKVVRETLADRKARRENSRVDLLSFVHAFAPEVSDLFGCSAALSRALNLEERQGLARTRLEGARRLFDELAAQGGQALEAMPEGLTRPERPPEETEEQLAAVTAALERVERLRSMALGEQRAVGDPAALAARREELQGELDRRKTEYEAISIALDALKRANTQLQERFSPELNRRAGEWMARLTGGKYAAVSLTRELEAAALERDSVLPRRSLALSRGTVDQLYLAVRLAVCQLCLPGEDPAPLVLDDALVTFDDRRMALALDALAELGRERQILLFTCQEREGNYLEGRPGVTRTALRGGGA